MADSDFWRDRAREFRELITDEPKYPPNALVFRTPVVADWMRMTGGDQANQWTVSGGSRVTRTRFEAFAERCGLKLRSQKTADLLGVWLDAVKEEFPPTNRLTESQQVDGTTAVQSTGGRIHFVIQASADLCSILEARALQVGHLAVTGDASPSALSPLLPGDPRNRLPEDARRRIQRTHIETSRFDWEAEAEIQSAELPDDSAEAWDMRRKAKLQILRAVLKVCRAEYSQIGLRDAEYRSCINDEIEAGVNSFELYDSHRRMLEAEFFYPDQPNDMETLEAARIRLTIENIDAQAQTEARKQFLIKQYLLRMESQQSAPSVEESSPHTSPHEQGPIDPAQPSKPPGLALRTLPRNQKQLASK
jgi:hypothetical protein